jgi:hypothetical protein
MANKRPGDCHHEAGDDRKDEYPYWLLVPVIVCCAVAAIGVIFFW